MNKTYTLEQILDHIQNEQPFEGKVSDGSFYLKIESYVPYISTAIHHGHQMRSDLEALCALDSNQRYHEEDPYTGDMIAHSPIALIAQDSRFEYDLNRGPDLCIHDIAWGKSVWQSPLSEAQRQLSLAKHQNFYKVCRALVEALLKKYPRCLIYDIHSYNILDRDYKNPPMFNIGTHFIDMATYAPVVYDWMAKLETLKIPQTLNEVKENEVYFGKGYVAESIMAQYPNCLVLPTEIKKIYADENEPKPYEAFIKAIHDGFERVMPLTAQVLLDKLS